MTRSYDPTADYVIERCKILNVAYHRINTDSLIDYPYSFHVSKGIWQMMVTNQTGSIDLSDVTSVWYRRPLAPNTKHVELDMEIKKQIDSESEALLRNLYALMPSTKWVSKPNAIREANNKLSQLVVAQALGFKVPDTLVTNSSIQAEQFYDLHLGKIIMKPFKPVVIDGIGNDYKLGAYTTRVTPDLKPNLQNVDICPTILQAEVEREYELRVTVFGEQVFAAKIETSTFPDREVDWRMPDSIGSMWSVASLPIEIAEKCKSIVRHYGLNFGAFDIAYTPEGEFVFSK